MNSMKNIRQTSKQTQRRGNAMVMVVGLLVLLVIIATSYIVRTNSGRVTAASQRYSIQRDDKGKAAAEMLADILKQQLFAQRYITPDGPGIAGPVSSNFVLASPSPFALRYEVDPTDIINNTTGAFIAGGDGFPDTPYNRPSYQVIPWTNWPDPDAANAQFWAAGPGNDHANAGNESVWLGFDGNPIGNPGFGDNRPLADNEPLRWDTTPNNGFNVKDAYSHWRHMSNIATANNGFRMVFGINDIGNRVGDDFGIGRVITNLQIPVEQWLAVMPAPGPLDAGAIYNTFNGNAIFTNSNAFYSRWSDWFFLYNEVYSDPSRIPPNFYDLSILGPAQDEFIAGTPRHAVGTVLTDTDGDGFTDAFWMLAPTMTESGIRQLVAVRIIDNSAMLNVNVGTQFVHADPGAGSALGFKTRSVTPADLLLVGEYENVAYLSGFNNGYFDIPLHHLVNNNFFYDNNNIQFSPNAWNGNNNNASFLAEIGVRNNANFPDQFTSAPDRLFYWQAAGSSPLNPRFAVTPFSLTEELELRSYHGQNIPSIASRLERAIQPNVISGPAYQFLHANLFREETNEILEQLNNRELLFDHRKRLTTYSGARNDLMPPWLWWRFDIPADVVAQGVDAENRFLAQGRTKLDLREVLNPFLQPGERKFAYRLSRTLLLALTDGNEQRGNSYYGTYTGAADVKYTNARRAAAAYAANILEWSDDDSGYDDLDIAAIPLPGSGLAAVTESRFLGIERQPFLVEALIAHIHAPDTANLNHPNDNIDVGDHILCATSPGSTIIAIQIANPFDDVLELAPFQLSVFGQLVQLPIATLNPGVSRTYYAVGGDLDDAEMETEWRALMNFNAIDTRNVTGMGWSTDRNFYDSLNTDETKEAVEIYRTINGIRVLVDRMDIASPTSEENFDFGESIGEDMRDALPTGSCVEPPSELLEWLDITNIEANTHWIQWSHVNRAWARDINSDMVISPDERNPRYVFSYREVDELTTGGQGFGAVVPDENPALFDETIKDNVPDANTLNFAMQMLQRDNDFEQVGELLNVFMFGHELEFSAAGAAGVYERTKQTFSEFMIDKALVGEKERVNRLHVVPDQIGSDKLGQVVGVGNPDNLRDPLQSIPDLPAGARVIDAFVCDGPGANFEIGIANADDYLGANGFTGKLTPGLLNINTAAQEVMRAIPHNYRLIHELEAPQFNPIVRLPEAIVRYREREIPDGADDKGPNYGDRGADDFLEDINPNTDLDDLRGDRGFASLGELLLLERSATFPGGLGGSIPNPNSNYRISFAGRDPFAATITGESSRISIDLNDVIDASGNIRSDIVSQDVEEQNLLFAGMSNLITTRSDVFTVYFRIRSFKQNPVGSAGVPVWDATDPEYIVDDSRYVMLVDRSEVNRPTDKPKILFLEKLAK